MSGTEATPEVETAAPPSAGLLAAERWAAKANDEVLAKSRQYVFTGIALLPRMGACEGLDDELLDARAQKALLLVIRESLVGELAYNQHFKAKTGWAWLDKLLTQTRLKELSQARIVQKGGSGGLRFSISNLKATFYGRQILNGLGFNNRRSVVTKEELATIKAALTRIKLTLPETVERTTTEKFFTDEQEEA